MYLSQRHGQNEVLEMRIPLNESESERQLRLNKYASINEQIRKTMKSACRRMKAHN